MNTQDLELLREKEKKQRESEQPELHLDDNLGSIL